LPLHAVAEDRRGAPHAPGGRLVLLWVVLCATAEAVGISVAVVWYALADVYFANPEGFANRVAAWLVMSAAALPEGLVLGGLQSTGIRWFLPTVRRVHWIAATTVVGLLGWAVGTWFPVFMPFEAQPGSAVVEPTVVQTVGFTVIFGACAGALIGGAQSFAMPTVNSGGGRSLRVIWIVANSIGWAIGLPCIYLAASFGADLSNVAARVAVWSGGALLAGAAGGAATGAGLVYHFQNRT